MSSKLRLMRSLREPRRNGGSVSANLSTILNTEDPIEEETLPRYLPQRYYPVHIGETFNNRFRVVAKLGYGSSSTIWLAQDTKKYGSENVGVACFMLLLTSQ